MAESLRSVSPSMFLKQYASAEAVRLSVEEMGDTAEVEKVMQHN